MTNKAKFTWFVLFIFSVIMMVMGILDGLHRDYSSAMINIGIGLIFFSYSFDLEFFMRPIDLANFFTPKKFEPFSSVSVIYYLGNILWVLGIIDLSLKLL